MRIDFREVKDRITMQDLIAHYKLPVSRSNRMKCPFHGGEHENLKIFEHGYYCHQCHVKGSVLDFAMHMEKLGTLQDAAQWLNSTFRLGLSGRRDPERDRIDLERRLNAERTQARKLEAQKNIQKKKEAIQAELDSMNPSISEEVPDRLYELMDQLSDVQNAEAAFTDREYLGGVEAVIDEYAPDALVLLPNTYPAQDRWTEQDLGKEFANSFSKVLGVIYSRKNTAEWQEYTGCVWKPSTLGLAMANYCKFSDRIEWLVRQAPLMGNELPYKKAAELRKISKARSVLAMAEHLLEMRTEDFDSQPHLLNTPGGVVNLETSEITPHRPEDRMRLCTTCAPAPEGGDPHPLWMNCLSRFAGNDPDLMNFLQCVAGMILFGQVYEECLIISLGDGRNGKSTFWNALYAVLGSYSVTINTDVFMMSATANDRKRETVDLFGKRFALAGESKRGDSLNDSTVKKLCSRDKMKGAQVYEAQIEFEPSHSLVMFTNNLPTFNDLSEGMKRRLIVIPAPQRIEDGEDKKDFAQRLVSEAGESILRWAIEGAWKFAQNGHSLPAFPDAVRNATDAYKKSNDIVARFLEECTEKDEKSFARKAEAFAAFNAWREDRGDEPISSRAFHDGMERCRVFTTTIHGFPGYRIRLKSGE